jgi:hypothetical protein
MARIDYPKGQGGKWMRTPLKKLIIGYLVMVMFITGFAPRVYAGFSPSEGVSLSSAERDSELKQIQKFLEVKKVRERLGELGLSPDEIQARLNQFSDPQIHQLALKLDDLKVAGDDFLGVIILLLVIAILVILLIQLTGHKIVIK